MDLTLRRFLTDLVERAAKTFVQGYLTFWVLAAGITNTPAEIPGASAYDALFTVANLKAGLVALAWSVATSLLSKPAGNPGSASLVDGS